MARWDKAIMNFREKKERSIFFVFPADGHHHRRHTFFITCSEIFSYVATHRTVRGTMIISKKIDWSSVRARTCLSYSGAFMVLWFWKCILSTVDWFLNVEFSVSLWSKRYLWCHVRTFVCAKRWIHPFRLDRDSTRQLPPPAAACDAGNKQNKHHYFGHGDCFCSQD